MRFILSAAAAVVLSGCASPSLPLNEDGVANPDASVPPLSYRSVTAGTADYQPVDPRPWTGHSSSPGAK